MDIELREERGCLVARPRMESLDYMVCMEFRDQVLGQMRSLASGSLILDLQDVAFVDSMAIGALVSLHKKGGEKGGRVALCGLRPFVAKVLSVVTVDDLFEVFADASRALAAVGCHQPQAGGV